MLRQFNNWIDHVRRGTFIDAVCDRLGRQPTDEQIREAWDNAVKNGQPCFRTIAPGVRLKLYPDEMLSKIIFDGTFEDSEIRFLRAYLRPGDVFYDIGANVGLFTLLAAKSVGSRGRVYSFEPGKKNFDRLTENVCLNRFKNVNCFREALSDKAEEVVLHVSVDGFGAYNSLAKPTAGEQIVDEVCPSVTLDQALSRSGSMGAALIKIDVEGWESKVIAGGSTALSKDNAPDLLVEFTDVNAKSAGTSCHELFSQIVSFGYKMFTIDHDACKLVTETMQDSYPYSNLLALKHPDKAAARIGYTLS